MAGIPQKLSKGQKREVSKILIKQVIAGLAILAIFTGLSIWGIYVRIEQKTEKLIAEQFKEPRIQQLLKEVAENQAKKIIEETLTPSIKKANESIKLKNQSLDAFVTKFETKYNDTLKKISQELKYLQKRNDILKLTDKAIGYGDAGSYEKLLRTSDTTTDEDLMAIVRTEIFRIKSFYATASRIGEIDLTFPFGDKVLKNEKIPTDVLLNTLKLSKNWKIRGMVADLLGNRKEKTVPEALLKALNTDQNLDVRRKAENSFVRITGYEFKDNNILCVKAEEKWWESNKEEKNDKLEELQTLKKLLNNKKQKEIKNL